MVVHLVDGTYELFRHFYGLRRFTKGKDRPYGAVVGVLQTVLQMIENGDRVKGSASRGPTYLGVATDHVIESFRNRLWADYKTGAGIEPALLAQFHPLEEALAAMGVVVWPMIELEADDALASAAHLASKDKKVEKVAIWTPDKDLAQCVRGTRVVQIDGRRKIDSRCGWDTRKVRRRSPAHSGPARARGRCGRRLPRHPWDRRQDRRPAFEPLRSDRKISVKRSRRTARSRAALQESRDAAHRCAALQEGRDAALARCHAGIRGLGRSDGIAAAARALRKGCGPMTASKYLLILIAKCEAIEAVHTSPPAK